MTAHVGTVSVDGSPISQTDLARIEAEEVLHLEQQRKAVRVVAAAALDVDDARMLLSILGLGDKAVTSARADTCGVGDPAKQTRKRRAAA